MPTSPEIINLTHDILKAATGLAEIKNWNKANGLVTMAAPGCSIGLEREIYESYTRDQDEATANVSILIWVKNIDPAAGEEKVRLLAQEARLVLAEDYSLNGAAATSYVHGIVFTTAEGQKSLLLHLAEIDFRVTYYSSRSRTGSPTPIDQVNNDVGAE